MSEARYRWRHFICSAPTHRDHQSLSIEAGRLMNCAARMMSAYQGGMLTIEKVRSGGKQVVVVQHVNVGDGGQAVVAGQVKADTKGRKRGLTGGG